ncbi:MAG: DUF4349 domain-containing protein [Rhizomicrobium sp.]|nr:DUF4349 domain-containing protein [Rhizomicrobium sp.]
MLRKTSLYCAALALVLAGCDKPDGKDKNIVHMTMPTATNAAPQAERLYAPPPPFVPPPDIAITTEAPRANALFSLQHTLNLAMSHDAVAVRFQVARDACLKEKTLHCVLTSASISATDTVDAQLNVALPHEQVAPFKKLLLKRLPQDGASAVDVTAQSTTTENQTQAAADLDRQLAQAKTYRDSLEALAKRSNLTVDEVLKIHEALTAAQEAVDSAEAAKNASDAKIVLEHLNISLTERPVVIVVSAFDGFWKNAGDIFMTSTAEMLLRIVNALPWLPLAGLLAWLAARFVRRAQIRRKHPDPT